MEKELNIDYTVQIWLEGQHYTAHAMPIDVMSSGLSPDEARQAVDEVVHLFLVTAKDMGTLDEILEECGYSHQKQYWMSPSWIAIEKRSTLVGV